MANTARRKDELEFEVTKPEFAGSANDIRTFSDQQREIQAQMNANSKAWHTADDAEKTRLHEQNQVLAAALGGSTSFNDQTGKWAGEGAYNKTAKFYGDQPGGYGSYSSKYSRQIDDLWNQLSNYGYGDFLNGDLYGALEGQYTRLGQQAMQDTLGQVAARTGGLASSYAGTVAQGAYNNYMQQLEQAAMDMYADEYGRKSNNLSTLMSLDNNAYNRFTNERDFNYALKQDELAQASEKAQMLAAFGDYSGYSALGYTPEQIAMMEAAAAAAAKGKGGPGKREEEYKNLFDEMRALGIDNNTDAVGFLFNKGIKDDDTIEYFLSYFNDGLEADANELPYTESRTFQRVYNQIMSGNLDISKVGDLIDGANIDDDTKDYLYGVAKSVYEKK